MQKLLVIGGPTASGKSALALKLAQKLDGHIVNADSQQIYHEIPIITAQPSKEEQRLVPHLLYGMVPVSEYFSVADWLNQAELTVNNVIEKNKVPILVGGTGLYIKALTNGLARVPEIDPEIRSEIRSLCELKGTPHIYDLLMAKDPEVAVKLNPNDRQRVLRAYEVMISTGKSLKFWHSTENQDIETYRIKKFENFKVKIYFLLPPREYLYENCAKRVDNMIKTGLFDEIAALAKLNISYKMPAMRAHGIREFIAYLNGTMSLDAAIAQTVLNTRHYIKRQVTWFRHQMPEAKLIEVIADENQEDIMGKILGDLIL